MKKIVILVAIVVLAFVVWKQLGSGGPEAVYEEFSSVLLDGNWARAAELSEGFTDKQLQSFNSAKLIGSSMIQDLFKPQYSIESSRKTSSGDVELTAVQSVFFNPPGVESAVRPGMRARVRHHVTLRELDGWKIVGFEAELIEVKELID